MSIAQIVLPSEAVSPGPSVDIVTIVIALVPFILMVGLIYWASKKKTRKQMGVEMSYNLIALELLLFVVLPICNEPFNCAYWAIIPILMFAFLVGFIYVRKAKEVRHKRRVAKALSDGHVELSELLQGKLEEEINSKKGGKEKEAIKKELVKKEPKELLKATPKPKKKESEHKKIEKMIDKVVEKNKKSNR